MSEEITDSSDFFLGDDDNERSLYNDFLSCIKSIRSKPRKKKSKYNGGLSLKHYKSKYSRKR